MKQQDVTTESTPASSPPRPPDVKNREAITLRFRVPVFYKVVGWLAVMTIAGFYVFNSVQDYLDRRHFARFQEMDDLEGAWLREDMKLLSLTDSEIKDCMYRIDNASDAKAKTRDSELLKELMSARDSRHQKLVNSWSFCKDTYIGVYRLRIRHPEWRIPPLMRFFLDINRHKIDTGIIEEIKMPAFP